MSKNDSFKPLIITSGEPAGIGPDIILDLASRGELEHAVICGDRALYKERARQLGKAIQIRDFDPNLPDQTSIPGIIQLVDCPTAASVVPGTLNPANSQHVLKMLDVAIEGIEQGWFSALVTAPLHKGVINDAGIDFSGHTEYLAKKTKAELPVMLLAHEGLRVALVTTHLPLKDVASSITTRRIKKILKILYSDLQSKFAITKPRIVVCGLNPHAGENGHLGREEIDIIAPALEACCQQGIESIGPVSADTVFTPGYLNQADAVLAMYHDQGLPVLKHRGFGQSVNITLGLPVIRTSVDHGTALELAGTGKADSSSLKVAIETAFSMYKGNND